MDFKAIERNMREAKKEDGAVVFNPNEFFNYKPIGSLFARQKNSKTTKKVENEQAEKITDELFNEKGEEKLEITKDAEIIS